MSDKGNSTWVEGRPTLSASDDNGTNHLVAHALRAEGHDASEDGTGRGTPLVVGFNPTAGTRSLDTGDLSPPVRVGTGLGIPSPPAVAFDWQSGGDVRHNASEEATSALQASQTPADGGGRMMVRRLTPLECCRLQGFPDDWLDLESPLSDSARYRMLGNAVCKKVGRWLGAQIAKVLQPRML